MSVDAKAYETIGRLSATLQTALFRLEQIDKQDEYLLDLDLRATKRILRDGLEAYHQFRKDKGWEDESAA